jgi:hypothetical protein
MEDFTMTSARASVSGLQTTTFSNLKGLDVPQFTGTKSTPINIKCSRIPSPHLKRFTHVRLQNCQ